MKEGDPVNVGQVLADRDRERARLSSQREQVQLSLSKIEQTKLLPPPDPLPVPEVQELPPNSYKEEEAQISGAELALQHAQRNYDLALSTSAFITQQVNLEMEKTKADAAQREVDLQQRKLDAIAKLKGLPPEVTSHETVVLDRKISERDQQQAKYNHAAAELQNAKEQRNAQLKSLTNEVEKARANVQLAQSHLQSAKAKRSYDEYQHSLTKARRTEEIHQFQQNQARQEQEYLQQQRDREFQIAQLNTKLGEIDQQLGELSTVSSPYAGFVKTIRTLGQNNQNLQFQITLAIGGAGNVKPNSSAEPFSTGHDMKKLFG
ncbi:MAG TPA: hypothetical protein DDZ80_23920 [Cyanobacteria bacterium UBA8803]|nr:hypothetical protein [Cyanobacteria bacterium UBA9273]HBL61364.1 hypothetical protein [Cyanobacteria bacterium UBA8803]